MSHVDTSLESLNLQIAFMRQELDHLRSLQKQLRTEAKVCFDNSAKLEAIIRAFEGFIYVCSADYEIEYINDRLIKRTGYDPTGRKCYEALHDRESICDWCVQERVMKGETVRWEVKSPKDSRYYYVVNTPIYYPDGSISKMSMIQDVTEQKENEIEREKLIAQLKSKNSDLEVFGHAISHDLRGPIITIKGLLRWIAKDAKSGQFDRLEKNMSTVFRSADRMEELITDLLKLSRVASMEDEFHELDFGEIVKEASDFLAVRISQHRVELEIQNDLPPVNFCRNKLLMIIQNLLENAVKYMGEQPKPLIRIGYRQDDDDLVFFVEDNGMGIKPEDQERIFELFVKLDEKSEGSGVGLAMLKRIMEGSHGRIWVESEGLGHGSRFCFKLTTTGMRCKD